MGRETIHREAELRLFTTHGVGIAAVEMALEERTKQNKKWGEQNHEDVWWLAILMEEVGELAECTLHARFGGSEAENGKKELVQVAAVALAWIENMLRRASEPASV